MDYNLEALGPDRFQKLCQAVVTAEYPDVQCLPVRRPDGGRDVISFMRGKSDEFVVFQVKFKEKPASVDDVVDWVRDAIEKEAPKVNKLAERGAARYVLATNVEGSPHLDSGAIDKVQHILDDQLPIQARCWWRNDLERRLDDNRDIKWSYPEILSGRDLVQVLVLNQVTKEELQNSTSIRSYLADQYRRDREVKFKQVDLQSNVLDLFIDVPSKRPSKGSQDRVEQGRVYRVYRSLEAARTGRKEERYRSGDEEDELVGTASLLLSELAQKRVRRIVLEGAPGQGKSTIGQYICQVHRIKLLQKTETRQLPVAHKNSPARLPFKIELRDFAKWLSKQDPFSLGDSDGIFKDWSPSLESFLAAHVRHSSGGADFSVSDLHATMKVSPVLLVLDGLDEVADIEKRTEVVDKILQGVSRLEEIANSLQTVVTSRPAAFSNSPGLPTSDFAYIHLGALSRGLITEYAEKWMNARRMRQKARSDVRNILKSKLNEAHLRELARNPMQLTILLNLIHTRGASLPDKRTALYDNYRDLFFNREAEKSDTVREYRGLIIEIHGFIAWLLHTGAEEGVNNGVMPEGELKNTIKSYLNREGHDERLVDRLFKGMVERVVALVSRVEGTYEFEVQPLREYFAARYLYDTAPYSPTGQESNGTMPDRFEAISRNFYWLNVTRFFAGCLSKGELPTLVDKLEVLCEDQLFKYISYPRQLAALLLSDWVFTQYPRQAERVVEILLDDRALRYLLVSSSRRSGSGDVLQLPSKAGRSEVIEKGFQILETSPDSDIALEVAEMIRKNTTYSEREEIWLRRLSAKQGVEETRWLDYGLKLRILQNIDTEKLFSVLHDERLNEARIDLMYSAGRFEILSGNEDIFKRSVDYILDLSISFGPRRGKHILSNIAKVHDVWRYACAFDSQEKTPLKEVWAFDLHRRVSPIADTSSIETPSFECDDCTDLIEVANEVSAFTAGKWSSEIQPWNELVEPSRANFGTRLIHYLLAVMAGAIKSKNETCTDASNIFDDSQPLCSRARYARLRAGSPRWWKKRFQEAHTEEHQLFLLSIAFNWASINTLNQIWGDLETTVTSLSKETWTQLVRILRRMSMLLARFGDRRKRAIKVNDVKGLTSYRLLISILYSLDGDDVTDHIFKNYLREYEGNDRMIIHLAHSIASEKILSDTKNWFSYLPVIKRSYEKGAHSHMYMRHTIVRRTSPHEISDTLAKRVIQNPSDYPAYLIALSEKAMKRVAGGQVSPVGEIARSEGWFAR